MNNTTIKAAKIKGNALEATYDVHLPGDQTNSITISSTIPYHDDLRAAFRRLDGHLAVLCEQYKLDGKKAVRAIVDCTSFKISGSGETEGVILSGTRDLDNAKQINLVSPLQRFENDTYDYKGIGDLEESISVCLEEVRQYLFHGKRQPDTQLDIFAGQEQQQENF